VRGLPVDRRSDVFSCGIVLYELLTGERLFVGESDYATLDKVRNVEILPPSTYNRKVPDELERIVLKALTKDVEDRYQNAIDLHDELQAFVYTAGEFYSRKDLAGWMKKTFTREIEEETAKLESYRQLKPPAIPDGMDTLLDAPLDGSVDTDVVPLSPAAPPPLPVRGPTQPPPLRRPTQPPPIAKPATMPPPVSRSQAVPVVAPASAARSQGVPVVAPASASRSQGVPVVAPASRSQGVPVVAPVSRSQAVPVVAPPSRSRPVSVIPPPSRSRTRSQPVAVIPLQSSGAGSVARAPAPTRPPTDDLAEPPEPHRPGPSSWDDDDLETRIYQDDEQRQKANRANLPLQPPVASSPGIELSSGDTDDDPDLSPVPAEWPPEVSIALSPRAARVVARRGSKSSAPPASSGGPSHASSMPEPQLETNGRAPSAIAGRELSAPNRLVAAAPSDLLPYESGSRPTAPRSAGAASSVPTQLSSPLPMFGARITAGRRPATDRQRTIFTVAIGAAALAAITVIIVMLASGRSTPSPPPAPVVRAAPAAAADPSTGFDLYVTPAGITQWKLDGESRTDRLPSRIRGIAPGPHTVQIDPPPGFLSHNQQVAVELGKASRVDIVLQPITGITGVFESSPPGATVSLIVDGKRQTIGPSPAKVPLDPRNTYQVLFEKPGYVSVNRPVTFSGGVEEHVIVNLEPTTPPASTSPRPAANPPARPASAQPASDQGAAAVAQGVLVLGSKPPCAIAIDGNPTGLHTPQKELKLAVGRRRITLTNSEFSIKDTFTVDIKADAPEKVIKDYSDQLPK
jgi:hypothetical protein